MSSEVSLSFSSHTKTWILTVQSSGSVVQGGGWTWMLREKERKEKSVEIMNHINFLGTDIYFEFCMG